MDTLDHNSESAEAGAPAGAPQAPGVASAVPPLVIRGERYINVDPLTGERWLLVRRGHGRNVEYDQITLPADGAHRYGAITDWLNFSFPFGPHEVDKLGPFFQRLFDVVSAKLAPATMRPLGKYNYTHSFSLGETKALFACGGNNGTALVSLPGEVCALVQDWAVIVAWGRDELGGRITRWDGAVDDYLGTHSVDEAVRLYEQGLFGAGGRQPRLKQHGNWISPDGSGRSVEFGLRESGKRLLVYEKGMQLGNPWHPWVRWELSLGNKDRVIPWEVLLEPGRYVAGAYPRALSWVDKEMLRVTTLQKQLQIGYDTAIGHAANQVGRLVNVMLEVEGSAEAALAKLKRPGVPRRLRHPAIDNPEAWID